MLIGGLKAIAIGILEVQVGCRAGVLGCGGVELRAVKGLGFRLFLQPGSMLQGKRLPFMAGTRKKRDPNFGETPPTPYLRYPG